MRALHFPESLSLGQAEADFVGLRLEAVRGGLLDFFAANTERDLRPGAAVGDELRARNDQKVHEGIIRAHDGVRDGRFTT